MLCDEKDVHVLFLQVRTIEHHSLDTKQFVARKLIHDVETHLTFWQCRFCNIVAINMIKRAAIALNRHTTP